MQVLVTGATGAVGPVVVAALVAAGWQVRALVRTPPPVGLLPAQVELVPGDITVPATLAAALIGCTGVVHLAALLHINNPPATLAPAYEAVNVTGTANLVQAALAAGVERFVQISTIAVYGYANRAGAPPLDETTVPQPDSLYAASKLRAEALVLQAQRTDGQPLGVVLRPAAIYGVRIKGNYQRLFTALARGRFMPLGAGHNRRTLIYDQDLAAAVVVALCHPAAAGRIYNVTDGHYHTLQQIISAICLALGRSAPAFSLPLAPIQLAVGLFEDSWQRFGRTAPLGRATLAKYCEEVVVDGRRLSRDLPFVPQTTLAAGWQAVAAAYRQANRV